MTLSLPDFNLPDFNSPRLRKRVRRTGRELQHRASDYAERLGEHRTFASYVGVAAVGFVAGAAVLSARKVAMQATTAVAGDWLQQLKMEHRMVEGLFDLVLKTEGHETGKRTALNAKITWALLKHGLQEETVIYPALRDGDFGADAKEAAAKHLAAEHFDIKTYLHELAELEKDDPQWLPTMRKLQQLVLKHVREEEEELYPPFHAAMSKEQNAKVTAAMNREGIKLA